MNVRQAIRFAIDNYGIEILNIPQKFQAIVVDYAEGYNQEMKVFAKCCRKDILSLAREVVLTNDNSKAETIAEKMRGILEEDFMAKEHAIASVNTLLQGLGVDLTLKKECIDENTFQYSGMYADICGKNNIQSKSITQKKFDKNSIIDKKIILNLKIAADNGDINAMITLGIFYKGGIIVEENWRLADYYFCQAADNGSREAKYKHVELLNDHMGE